MMLKYYHMDRHSEENNDYIQSRLYITTQKLGINNVKDLMLNIDKYHNEPVWNIDGYEVKCDKEEYECLSKLGALWLTKKPPSPKQLNHENMRKCCHLHVTTQRKFYTVHGKLTILLSPIIADNGW
jgi:hypothetical protein